MKYPPLKTRLSVVVAIICFLIVADRLYADWEALPDPELTFAQGHIIHDTSMWRIHGNSFCEPFMVSDGHRTLFIGHPGPQVKPIYETYDTWVSYDVETRTYTPLRSPAIDHHPVFGCALASPDAVYMDGKIFLTANLTNQNLVYDVSQDRWSVTDLPIARWDSRELFAADPDGEFLYWWTSDDDLRRIDPDIGGDSMESFTADYDYRDRAGLFVEDNQAIWAGGLTTQPAVYDWYSEVVSSVRTYVHDFVLDTTTRVADIPFDLTMAGCARGATGLHFLGNGLISNDWLFLPQMDHRYVYDGSVKHMVYHPDTDEWEWMDDLPPYCLPLSAVGLKGWMYGLFVCHYPGPDHVVMYRTFIGAGHEPVPAVTSTTTTSTTTTSTSGEPDDDADDDSLDPPDGSDDADGGTDDAAGSSCGC